MAITNDLIKQRRLGLGLTQAEMASRLGIAQSAYSRYENTDVVPAADRLYQIANALGVTMESLMAPDDYEMGDNPTAIDRLIVECSRLHFECEPVYTDTAKLRGFRIVSASGEKFMPLKDIAKFQEALNGFAEDYLTLFLDGGIR